MQKTLVPAFPEVLENCYAIVESGQKNRPEFSKAYKPDRRQSPPIKVANTNGQLARYFESTGHL